MKVFISWSGDRSKVIAQALHELLPMVLHYVKPWMSQTDLSAGERWAISIGKELQETNYGIICLTSDNLNSPWLLFEAGALAKSLENSRVIPLLHDLDFKQVGDPLAQFQAKKISKVDLKEIARAINDFAESPVPSARIDKYVDLLWSDFEEKLKMLPKVSVPVKSNRTDSEILEELVRDIRRIDTKVYEIKTYMQTRTYPGKLSTSQFDRPYKHRLMDSLVLGQKDPHHLRRAIRITSERDPELSNRLKLIYRDLGHPDTSIVLGAMAEMKKIISERTIPTPIWSDEAIFVNADKLAGKSVSDSATSDLVKEKSKFRDVDESIDEDVQNNSHS